MVTQENTVHISQDVSVAEINVQQHIAQNLTRHQPNVLYAKGQGDHPANYKGCQVYKQLQRFRKPTPSKQGITPNNNQTNTSHIINAYNNNNVKTAQQQILETNSSSMPHPSNAQAAVGQKPNSPNQNNDNSHLTNLLNEFKVMISPLLSPYHTFDRLLTQNIK